MPDPVTLRPVTETDLPVLYDQQRDPVANQMAAFPAREWAAFESHWKGILADPTVVARAIVQDRHVAGYVAVFGSPDERLVGYWIGREHWGHGIATNGLALFLDEVVERPLSAHVAKSNHGSIRVLEKCAFTVSRDNRVPFASGADVIDEWIMTRWE